MSHVKKLLLAIVTITCTLLMLPACGNSTTYLEQQQQDILTQIAELEEQKNSLESDVIRAKENQGTAKYIITFSIKQTHVTLSISEHIKDAMNECTIEIPVDKEYYDSVSVGDVISEEFRAGSLIIHGSFGNWKVTVVNKEIA